MTAASMAWPLVAMVALVLAVWLRLYQLRFTEMMQRRITPQELALSAPKAGLLQDTRASDNFRNLFELPALFHVGVMLALVLQLQDRWLLALAWAYVGLRALHSLVHCSYNDVRHRFGVYAASSLVLFALWARLAWVLA